MPFNTQKGVTVTIAGRNQRVVYTAGSVLDEGEDGAPAIGAKDVTDLWHKPQGMRTSVLHRHELTQIIAIERPSVYHLLSVGIDDPNVLPTRNLRRFAPSCRYLNRGCSHFPTSLGFGASCGGPLHDLSVGGPPSKQMAEWKKLPILEAQRHP
jgi:hypothetical protein